MINEKEYSEWMGKQGFDVLRHANCCKIAFNGGWESQQSKVDELQKKLDEYIFVAESIDEMYVKEVQKNNDLQKQVDAALQEIKGAVRWIDEDAIDDHAFIKAGVLRAFARLEQALKGGEA